MLMIIGLIALLPMSVRLGMWGRHRALPRAWLAWLPLAAPIVWCAGNIAMSLAARARFSDIGALPASERSAALSDGIAEALQLSLAAGIAAVVVLTGCFAFFALRPRAADPLDDDADLDTMRSAKG